MKQYINRTNNLSYVTARNILKYSQDHQKIRINMAYNWQKEVTFSITIPPRLDLHLQNVIVNRTTFRSHNNQELNTLSNFV